MSRQLTTTTVITRLFFYNDDDYSISFELHRSSFIDIAMTTLFFFLMKFFLGISNCSTKVKENEVLNGTLFFASLCKFEYN